MVSYHPLTKPQEHLNKETDSYPSTSTWSSGGTLLLLLLLLFLFLLLLSSCSLLSFFPLVTVHSLPRTITCYLSKSLLELPFNRPSLHPSSLQSKKYKVCNRREGKGLYREIHTVALVRK